MSIEQVTAKNNLMTGEAYLESLESLDDGREILFDGRALS